MSPGRPSPVRRLVLALARVVVGLHPPEFRARFGEDMKEDWARLAGEGEGTGRLLLRVLRDAARLPSAWLRIGRGRRASGRDPRGDGPFQGVFQDLRGAARTLRRNPGFTWVTGSVLALGVAGCAAVFALVNAYLVRPLPFPAPDRLMGVTNVVDVPWNEEHGDVLEHAISWDLDAFTLLGPEGPRMVRGAWVAPGFFDAFGIEPALGRGFAADEAGEAGASVAVISHELWQTRFAGDPGVLGRTVTTFASDRPEDSESFTIVGVLPREFWFFNRYTEMLVPLRAPNPVYMARLQPGVSAGEASARLEEIARSRGAPADVRIGLEPFQDRYVRSVRPTLLLLQGAVLLVFLVACANAAVLLLVRGAGREREFALRKALGAGRTRLTRQLVAEGLLLAGTAGIAGLVVAAVVVEAAGEVLQSRLGVSAPGGVGALGVDVTVVAVSLALVVLTGVVFGLVPLVGAGSGGRGGLAGSLTRGGRGHTGGRGHRRLRSVLVTGELALSLALLIAAGLSVRSAVHVARLDFGFDPERVVKAEVNLRQRSYPEATDRIEFFDRLVAEARSLPGVAAAGATIRVPFTWRFGNGVGVEAEGRPAADRSAAPRAVTTIAGPGYLDAMGISLLRGRDLDDGDGPGTERVAVVTEGFARALWPGEDPLGRRFRELPAPGAAAHGEEEDPTLWTVVGVAEEIRHGLEVDVAGTAWVPYGQVTPTSMTVVLRRRPGAGSPVPALEELVRRMDPTVAVTSVADLEDATLEARAPARFLAVVLGAFGAFAVVLAVLGLYGVVSYAASRARRDVAVRMALGARRTHVEALFLRQGAAVVVLGTALGLGGAVLLSRLVETRLQGVSATDPLTYGALAALMAGAALLATWLPARRAARRDPMEVLREE